MYVHHQYNIIWCYRTIYTIFNLHNTFKEYKRKRKEKKADKTQIPSTTPTADVYHLKFFKHPLDVYTKTYPYTFL